MKQYTWQEVCEIIRKDIEHAKANRDIQKEMDLYKFLNKILESDLDTLYTLKDNN